MIFKYLKAARQVEDEDFDLIYPESIRGLSDTHFTPIRVAKKAAKYLTEKSGTKVLDIGSGAGKFCMIGAVCTDGCYTGVEQRANLHGISIELSEKYKLSNLQFIHSNITEIDFQEYDAFYFYNSFFENIIRMDGIDDTIPLNSNSYLRYSLYVKNQLRKMPIGTRLVTCFSSYDEVPDSYQIQSKVMDERLTMWMKVSS